MAEIHSLQCLPSYVLHERLWYPPLISVQLVKHRVVAVLEHQVKPPLPPEDFQEADEVGMLELLEHADFSKGDFLYDRVIFGFQKPLDGHDLTRVSVSALEHYPIGTFSNLSNFFVFLHYRGARLLENGFSYSF